MSLNSLWFVRKRKNEPLICHNFWDLARSLSVCLDAPTLCWQISLSKCLYHRVEMGMRCVDVVLQFESAHELSRRALDSIISSHVLEFAEDQWRGVLGAAPLLTDRSTYKCLPQWSMNKIVVIWTTHNNILNETDSGFHVYGERVTPQISTRKIYICENPIQFCLK